VYETEDTGSAGFYRFLPNVPGSLAAGGRLQMLAVKYRPNYDTRRDQRVGQRLLSTWVDIDNPDPALEQGAPSVAGQGFAKGAAAFARLEGAWYGSGSIFINSTSGGDIGRGQVWQYTPYGANEGYLTLLYESRDPNILDSPDNLCVSPRGGLVLCEDGSGEEFLHGLTLRGQIFKFAQNIVPGFEGSELAGATFSPDGQTLFFNIQSPGLTFAVWGPWEAGAL
jgi:secreted PhoX family phosphatase